MPKTRQQRQAESDALMKSILLGFAHEAFAVATAKETTPQKILNRLVFVASTYGVELSTAEIERGIR